MTKVLSLFKAPTSNVRRLGLLLIASIVMPCALASAEDSAGSVCVERGAHEGTVFFLIDRSDKLKDVDSLKQTLASVKESTKPGERLIIGTSTGKKSDTHVIFDMVRVKADVWESALKIRAKEKKFGDCYAKTEGTVLEQNQDSPTSALVETIGFVADILKGEAAGNKRLIMFSDMIQHSDALNLYAGKSVDIDGSVAKLDKAGLIPTLSNVTVSIAGAGVGVADDKARAIEKFWRKLFEKAGATVKFYGPVLLGE